MTVILCGARYCIGVSYPKILVLRDNVQHHLQGGRAEPGYSLIHALADAPLAGQMLRTDAHRLWEEISLAITGLADLPLDELAASIRTQAVTGGSPALPLVRGTALVRVSGWTTPVPVVGAATLGDLFEDLGSAVALVTTFGKATGYVHAFARLPLGARARALARIPARARAARRSGRG